MKKLTKAIMIVAILNLLAVLGGVGWMLSSGRVSKSRMMEMTSLFQETVAATEAQAKAEQAAIDKEIAEQEKPLPAIPLNAAERNLVRVEMTQVDRQRSDRMKREVENLQATLRKESRLIEVRRAQLEEEKEEFRKMRQRLAGLEGGKQFKKSLGTLSELKSKDAKVVLSKLLEQEKDEEVITYLSSMESGVRTGIISEFIKSGEEELAADLLESIRMRGLELAQTNENP
jgi:flagellar basal body-associated protein FliL